MSPWKRAVRVEVKDSAIHGRGLFTLDSIPKGARIIEYAGERVVADEGHAPSTRRCRSTRSSSISRTGS